MQKQRGMILIVVCTAALLVTLVFGISIVSYLSAANYGDRTEQAIKAAEFNSNQPQLLDQQQAYQTALNSVWQGFWLRLAGYPKINTASTDTTIDTFKAKRDTGIQPAN